MNIITFVKKHMKEQKITQVKLAEILGLTGQNVVSTRLRSKNTTVASSLEMLNALGYVLIAQPDDMPLPDGATLITLTDEEEPVSEDEKMVKRYRKQLDKDKLAEFDALPPEAQIAVARFSE